MDNIRKEVNNMFGEPNIKVARVPKDKNFTCLNSAILFDSNLSDTARLLLAQMLTVREDKWNLNIEGLRTNLKRGIKAVKSALAELEQHGYLFKQQLKDKETHQFSHNQYFFYESPSLNPHFGKSYSVPAKIIAQQEPDFFESVPIERKPTDGQENLSNTNPSNTKESNMVMGQSVTEEKTDGLSAENKDSNQENLLKEIASYPYLDDMLNLVNSDEVNSKLKEIKSTEHSLISFMTKLQKYCDEALKNLRKAHARDNYLRKVISGFLNRYTPCSDKQTQNSKIPAKAEKISQKPMPFGEMLLKMKHPDVNEHNYQHYPFDTQEHFLEYYGQDCYYWEKHECCIPDSFMENQATMLNALRFLFSSCLQKEHDEKFNAFSEECVSYLAEVLCTGKRSYTHPANSWNLIKNINYLNIDIYGNDISLYTFMKSFYFHFRKKLEEYSIKSNYKGYVTSMLVSYLNNEYLAQTRVKSTEFELFYGDDED